MAANLRDIWNKLLGNRGEREAEKHLRKQGLKILARGYRTSQGEIDLIARDGDQVVFVEVKTRRQGTPSEAVTLEKQRRLTLTALHFLKKHGLLESSCRFDVIAIVWPDETKTPTIEQIRDAFEAVGRGQLFR